MNRRYFAYGSNLNLADWHRWCGENGFREGLMRPLFRAWLPDRRLAFTRYSTARQGGVLDILPARGHLVNGLVFAVDEDGWRALERKEGAPRWYEPCDTEVLTPDGLAHPVRTFEVAPASRQRFVVPKAKYLDLVLAVCREFGISTQATAAAATNEVEEPAIKSLFVYGTLMRGEARSALLADRSGVFTPSRVCGSLHDLGSYPGLTPEPSSKRWVFGEIHGGVGAEQLAMLDGVEGFPGFEVPGGLFRRRMIDTHGVDGQTLRAWVYVASSVGGRPRIESGDWRVHRRQSSLLG